MAIVPPSVGDGNENGLAIFRVLVIGLTDNLGHRTTPVRASLNGALHLYMRKTVIFLPDLSAFMER